MAIIINEVSSEKINNAFNLIIENGGKVYKDNTFSVKGVDGKFSLDGDKLTVVITGKPFFAPMGLIEDKIMEFFG